jgi:DnaJ-class molecular chaperone
MGSSAQHRLTDPTCPRCHGYGSHPDDAITPWKSNPCSLCDGKGSVTLSVATSWILAQGKGLDLDYSTLADTQPESKP